jgi:hypothetical protein
MSYVVSLLVCVIVFICMKVCMFVYLVLYILSNVLFCFIMDMCQWVRMYESLYVCLSCPVYILSKALCCFNMGVCQWVHLYESLSFLCVLSCICCQTSYVVSLWVCVSEFTCMKVCIFVCLVLYILWNVLCCFIIGVCQWVHLYKSLYDCVSCPVYVVERLMLFHHGCVSEFIWMKVCMIVCLVLYMLSNVLCCFIMGVCQWVRMYESLYICVSCAVYIVERLMLFHYGCVSVSSSVWKFVCLCILSCIYCRTSYVVSLWVKTHLYKLSYRWTHWHTPIMKQHKTFDNIYRTRHTNIQTFIQTNSLTHTHNETT